MPKPVCPFGLERFDNKRAAEKAHPGLPVDRCDHCRGWHVAKSARGKKRRR